MALKVLIADRDSQFVSKTSKFLKCSLYGVERATNGKSTQAALFKDKYFALILNYGIQNHSAVEVLNFCRKNQKQLKVIIVFDDDEPIKNEETSVEGLIKAGATDILIKPFSDDELADVLEDHQSFSDLMTNIPKKDGISEETIHELFDEKFTKIPIDDFFTTKSMLFPVYVKLGKNKYVKILHAGDEFEQNRLQKYRDKKVENLYIEKRDRRKYILLNNYLAKKAIHSKHASSELKTKLLKNVTEKYLEETFSEGLKPQIIDQGKEICENVAALIEKDETLFKTLREFQEIDPTCMSHAFLMTIFTTAIVKQFEWQSKMIIENAALACMLHDIGKTKLPPSLIDKRPEHMEPEELEEYHKHPDYSAEIVSTSNMINSSIKQIIVQHHEAFDGTGFPRKLKGTNIVTLGNILCLCDDFAHIIASKQIKPIEALKELLADKVAVKRYDSRILENFIKVFADPAKIKKEYVLPTRSKLVKKAG